MSKELIIYQGDLNQLCADKFNGDVTAMASGFAKADVVVLSHVASINQPNGGMDAAYPKMATLLASIKSANPNCKIFGYVPGTADAPLGTGCGYTFPSNTWSPAGGIASNFVAWANQWAAYKEIVGIFVDLASNFFMSPAVRDSVFSYVKNCGLNIMANTPITNANVQFALDSIHMGLGDYIHVEGYGIIAGKLDMTTASIINRTMASYSVEGKTPRQRGINLAALITEPFATNPGQMVDATNINFLKAQALFNSGYVLGDVLQYTTSDLGIVSNNFQIEGQAIADIFSVYDKISAEIENIKAKKISSRGLKLLQEASEKLMKTAFMRLNILQLKSLIDKNQVQIQEALRLYGTASNEISLKAAIASENIKSVFPLVEQISSVFKENIKEIGKLISEINLEEEKKRQQVQFTLKKIEVIISNLESIEEKSEELLKKAKQSLKNVTEQAKGSQALELLSRSGEAIDRATHYSANLAQTVTLAKKLEINIRILIVADEEDVVQKVLTTLVNIESLIPLAETNLQKVRQNTVSVEASIEELQSYQDRTLMYQSLIRTLVEKFENTVRELGNLIKSTTDSLNVESDKAIEPAVQIELYMAQKQMDEAKLYFANILQAKTLANQIDKDLKNILFSRLTREEAKSEITIAGENLKSLFPLIETNVKKINDLVSGIQQYIEELQSYQDRTLMYQSSIRSLVEKFENIVRELGNLIKSATDSLNIERAKTIKPAVQIELDTAQKQIEEANLYFANILQAKTLANQIDKDLKNILFSRLTCEEANSKITIARENLKSLFPLIKTNVKKINELTDEVQMHVNIIKKFNRESVRIDEARSAGAKAQEQQAEKREKYYKRSEVKRSESLGSPSPSLEWKPSKNCG